jgi:excinuclease ABC subunit A
MRRYRGYTACPGCGGSRLRPKALYVHRRQTLADLVKLNIAEAREFFSTLSSPEAAIADKICSRSASV